MIALLQWFGDPFLFYLVALIALSIFLFLAIHPQQVSLGKFKHEWAFLAATALVVFAWRWPIFLYSGRLNPDEGLWAAGALKTTVDFVPWRGVDSTTSGPLSCYLLALPALFGLRIDFFSMRAIGTAVLVLSIFALYYAVKWTHGKRIARLAVVPATVMLSLTKDPDFIAFTSEYLPILMTTAALAAAVFLVNGTGSISTRVIAAAIAGILVGSTGFAKLQSLPIGAIVFVFAAGGILLAWRRKAGDAGLVAIAGIIGLLSVPAILLTSLWLTGGLSDAATSYLKMSAGYVSDGKTFVGLPYFFGVTKAYVVRSYIAFSICAVFVVLVAMMALVYRGSWNLRRPFAALYPVLLLFVACFAIYKAHRGFPHYLLFAVIPLSCCVAAGLGLTREANLWQKHEWLIVILFTALFVLPQLSVAMVSPNPFASKIIANWTAPPSKVAQAISRYAKPGTRVAIWGWMPDYYVETGTIMATRDAQTAQQIISQPLFDYFRSRYMSDLQKSLPPVFVDAVASGSFRFRDRAMYGYENFHPLADLVHKYYDLKEDIAGVRIFTLATSGSGSASNPVTVPARKPAAEVAPSVRPIPLDQIRALHEVTLTVENNHLLVAASGGDPQLLLPKMEVNPTTTYSLQLEIEVPADTDAQLYYQTSMMPSFAGTRRVSTGLKKGRNTVVLKINDVGLNGIIRLDPGRVAGQYILHAVTLLSPAPAS